MRTEEQVAIDHINRTHLTKRRNHLYLALEGLDFVWSLAEVSEFRQMWRKGFSIYEIAEYFQREDVDEVALLVMCQMRKGRIRQRKGGLFGWVNTSTCKA